MRFVSYQDRRAVAAALRPVYTTSNADTRPAELDALTDSVWGSKYPHLIATWTNAWQRFIPFLAFPPAVRRSGYRRLQARRQLPISAPRLSLRSPFSKRHSRPEALRAFGRAGNPPPPNTKIKRSDTSNPLTASGA